MSKINGSDSGNIGAGRKLFIPTDTLFANQWHLLNTGQSGGTAGIDLNVTSVWDDYNGAGINVAVIDDGFDYLHSDLAPNYDTNGDFDFGQNDTDSAPVLSDDDHGTATMGLIGADDNGTGTVGVASDATLLGYRVDFSALLVFYQFQVADAIARAETYADVVNMSLGISDYSSIAFNIGSALESGVASGRGGLGTNYVVAGGNSRGGTPAASLDVGVDSLSAARETITVAAINDDGNISSYSSPGAALLVSAFGSPASGEVWTTDRTGSPGYNGTDHTSTFNGTSAAAPQVAGVVALMLDANENLGWRDVQDILAYSAVHTGTAIGSGHTSPEFYDWGWNGAQNWNGGGLHFSNDYGFGLVDALAAVRLAETWTSVQTSANEVSASGNNPNNFVIPDNSPVGVTFTVDVGGNVEIDSIELDINLIHTFIADLIITLTSPDGTVSTILDETAPGFTESNSSWVYTSSAFRGEESQGTWTIFVADRFLNDTGTVTDTTITAFGSALPVDDLYVYTNEYSDYQGVSGHSTALSDADGGDDTLNAAAVTAAIAVDLAAGTTLIDGIAGTVAGVENVFAGDGNDTLTGNASDNLLHGGRGADTLDGGGGSDTISYASSVGAVSVNLAAQSASGGDAAGDVISNFENATGGAGSDNLTGNGLANLLRGNAGTDVIDGGIGNDTIYAGADQDYAYGGSGDDFLFGEEGIDSLSGNEGNDTIDGGSGLGVLVGGSGNDSLTGGGDKDYLYGEGDNDTLYGGAGIDVVVGGDNDDELHGGADYDYMYGQNGADVMYGEGFSDYMSGGAGDDMIYGGEFYDLLYGDAGNDTIYGGTEEDYLFGGADNDQLFGEAGRDTIYGGSGDDTLDGGAGIDADRLYGEGGNDVFTGGAGADQFILGSDWGDTITDFEVGLDTINVYHVGGPANFAALTITQDAPSGNTFVDYGAERLILEGFVILAADDFSF